MSNDKPDYPPIRRVITGHDAGNLAKVLIDGAATNAKYPAPGAVSTLIWCTDHAPAAIPPDGLVAVDPEEVDSASSNPASLSIDVASRKRRL